jgi:hypothetical protein
MDDCAACLTRVEDLRRRRPSFGYPW